MARSLVRHGFALIASAQILAACQTTSPFQSTEAPPAPPPAQQFPATVRAEELVGRWGLAAYHRPEDRARTEVAARQQCNHPYTIGRGQTGGILMHLADKSEPQELVVKGGPGGKNYIGPAGEPGGPQDREIVSFDGRTLITQFIDQDAATRYGTMVYARCGIEGTKRRKK